MSLGDGLSIAIVCLAEEPFSSLTNFSVPDTLTSNGFTTTMTRNTWLGLTQDTGPNADSTSLQRPTQMSDWSGTSGVSYVDATSSARQTITQTGAGVTTKTTRDGFGRVVKVERATARP